MSIEKQLEEFSDLVRAYARSREIERQVRRQGAEFAPELVEQVAEEHRKKAMKIMCDVLDRIGTIEFSLIDARKERRELEQRRIELEYQLDEVALHRRVGDADANALDAREVDVRRALDLLEVETELLAGQLEQLRRGLDLWYDVGADTVDTM